MILFEGLFKRTAEGGVEVTPQVKLSFGVGTAVLLFVAFKKAPEFANTYYALYEHVANNRLYLATSCILLICLGWTLSRPNWLRAILVLLGFAVLPVVVVLPQIPATRWTTPSVIILPGDENSVRQLESAELSNLVSPSGTISYMSVPKHAAEFIESMIAARDKNPDVVIVDYYYPFRKKDVPLFNPRTLYLLTRQSANRELLDILPNVLLISPSIIDEVFAISKLIPRDATPIFVFRSDDDTGYAAQEMLRQLLSEDDRKRLSTATLATTAPVEPADPGVTVVLDWARTPSQVLRRAPKKGIVIAGSHADVDAWVRTPKLLLAAGGDFRTRTRSPARENQRTIMLAVLRSHFESNRPINPVASVRKAGELLKRRHLMQLSFDGEVVYRYAVSQP